MKKLIILFILLLSSQAWGDFSSWSISSWDWGGCKKGQRCTDLVPIAGLSPTSYAYGDHDINTTTDQSFTLSNTGNGLLSAATLTVSGTSYSLLSTTCGSNPFDLAAGANCTATVRFAPLTAALFNGSLTLSAPNLTNVVTSLSGTGVAPADVTAPTLSSATIGANGTTWSFLHDEVVNIGAGGNAGWAGIMTTAGGITLTYASGAGSNTLVYTGSPTVNSGDTGTIAYTQPGNGIEDTSGNDLATIANAAVTNNSTQTASTTIAQDAFTGADNTTLASHNLDVGGTWTLHPSYSGTELKIATNRLRGTTLGVSAYYASATPSSANYTVSADIYVMSSQASDFVGVIGRCDTTANTFYFARYYQTAGGWQLYKYVSGTATQLGSTFSQALTVGNSYNVVLAMSGTSIKLRVDGVERISVTDSDITAAGKAGVRKATGGTTTTYYHLDNFKVTE